MQHDHTHSAQCQCFSRRRLLSLGALSVAGLALSRPSFAGGHADALVLNCMDYRLVDEGVRYFTQRGLTDKYDQVILAGASIGALGKLGAEWASTFWKHVDTAKSLHSIKRVIVMDHRDCGAYKIVFGAETIADRDLETALHRSQMIVLQKQLKAKHADLEFEALLMNLDGSVEQLLGSAKPQTAVQAPTQPRVLNNAPKHSVAPASGPAPAHAPAHAPAAAHSSGHH